MRTKLNCQTILSVEKLADLHQGLTSLGPHPKPTIAATLSAAVDTLLYNLRDHITPFSSPEAATSYLEQQGFELLPTSRRRQTAETPLTILPPPTPADSLRVLLDVVTSGSNASSAEATKIDWEAFDAAVARGEIILGPPKKDEVL